MARSCLKCRVGIPRSAWVDGRKRNLQNRRYCLLCSPFGSHNTRVPGETRRHEPAARHCDACGRHLPQNHRKGKRCWACAYGQRAAKRMDKAYAVVGQKCWNCGYVAGSKRRRVLEFHHIDRAQKRFGLDCRNIVNLAWFRVFAEMQKCVLLCANCHREVECGHIPSSRIQSLHRLHWDLMPDLFADC
jgi:hypothetical protein